MNPQPDLFNQPTLPHFSGAGYEARHDHARLTGQLLRLYGLLTKGAWMTLSEMEAALNSWHPEHHHPQASLSAQIRNLRKPRFGGHKIEKRPRGNRDNGLFEYRLCS